MRRELAAVVIALAFLGGCGRQEMDSEGHRVAAVLPENGKIHATYYWQKVWEGVHEGAAAQHLRLSEYQTDENNHTVLEMLELAGEADVDGIIINPSPNVSGQLLTVREKGCKVAVLDSDIGEEYYDVFIGINNDTAARQLADYLIQNYKGGEILLLRVEASKAIRERYEAFEDAMEAAGLKDQLIPLELREENEERIEDIQQMLEADRDIRWMVSFDPSCTLQAAESIERLKLSDTILLVGFGESDTTKGYMQDQTIDALLLQDNVQLGRGAAELVGQLIEGKVLEEKQVYIDTQLLTAEEVD